MPLVKLTSAQPMAFGKNSLLQKKCEITCNILEHTRKESHRKLEILTEQCVASAYTLLLEAETYEKEKLDKAKSRRTSLVKRSRSFHGNTEATSLTQLSSVIRPMTAAAHGSQTPRADNTQRPYSAQPNQTRFSLINHSEIFEATIPEDEIVTEITFTETLPDTGYSTARLTEPPLTPITPKPPSEKPASSVNEKMKLLTKLNCNKRRASKPSPPQFTSTPRPAVPQTPETPKSPTSVKKSLPARPRTAHDYRKKIEDPELDAYWKKRVRNMIRKWDYEDKCGIYRHEHNTYNDDDEDEQVPVFSPVAEMPNPFFSACETEAAIKTKKFLQNYGSKYKSLLGRPATAPASDTYKIRSRRPVKATRQELNSIKADVTRQKKQTNAILRKSRRIKNHIQNLVDYSKQER